MHIMLLMTTVIQFPERTSRPLVAIVSNEVRALLGRYDVSQTELAQWLGITQPAVSARLRSATEWKVAEIERIAEGFSVHPAVLMGGYAPNPPEGPLPILQARGGGVTHQPVGLHTARSVSARIYQLPAAG